MTMLRFSRPGLPDSVLSGVATTAHQIAGQGVVPRFAPCHLQGVICDSN